MRVLNIQQAKTHLSRLVEEAMAGEEIVIAKAGRPCVVLEPWAPEGSARTLGGEWEGRVQIAPDFDSTDPAVIALFEGGTRSVASRAVASRAVAGKPATVKPASVKPSRAKRRKHV